MIAGLSGSLLSHDAVRAVVTAAGCTGAAEAHRQVSAWHAVVLREMGPTSSARAVFDRVALPLCRALGFRVTSLALDPTRSFHSGLEARGRVVATMFATEWGRDPAAAWRESVRTAIGAGVRWCLCITGPVLRILDARRTYSRRFAQFDLEIVAADVNAFNVFWFLLNVEAFSTSPTALDSAIAASERYRAEVRTCLQGGVQDALTALLQAFVSARGAQRSARDPKALLDEALIVVYRVLFLLFAEARGLVPNWHPTYRDSYTIEALRPAVETLPRPPGLWNSLQAIARLAYRGCRAGSLRVPPFNGRLFSPLHAPLAESLDLDDGAVRQALMSLTTRVAAKERQRIAYADLGVEQLGGVYERILDYEPAVSKAPRRTVTLVAAGRRKATGTFYTPRALTEFLVRRALAPLVTDASSDEILSLRVLDPAMGSGAFLVAACRYLALAYESALIREGVVSTADLDEPTRAGFRRVVAQRCLFGVDINPMAVQLGRLSLWLATLASDRPLTFLDHHLRTGNSIVGASLEDVLRRPPSSRRTREVAHLPLFDVGSADSAVSATVRTRLALAMDPGETIDQVRAKERLLSSLQQRDAPLTSWKAVADLWCSEWFGDAKGSRRTSTFSVLADQLLGRTVVLPAHVSTPLLERAAAIAQREIFFHWPLEFPEVFHDVNGQPSTARGFDAVIGNPPWEMLRGERGGNLDSAAVTAFTRSSGVYAWQGNGHANLYQLFLERAVTLTRRGGRLALVLPSGFAIDHGCADLRRALLDSNRIDTFVSIENRDGVFPIHRGLKILLMTATRGGHTAVLPCRSGVRSPEALDELPDSGDPGAVPLPRGVIQAFTGDQLAIPEVRSSLDVAILSRCALCLPTLSGPEGWNVAFGRELNATEDRKHFVAATPASNDLAIVEGKQVQPFVVEVDASRWRIPQETAKRLLGGAVSFRRPGLVYRDVASSTNRLTLIAAIVPGGVVTTHTLFRVKGLVEIEIQWFLCGIFNSLVANYLVRTRVGTHVTVSILERLPVPKPSTRSRVFGEVVALSRSLAADPGDAVAAARLQARAARLYDMTPPEFQHVLNSFPLIAATDRAAAMREFMLLMNDPSALG